jgi:hypothetical protein
MGYTISFIKDKLKNDLSWIERALIVLWERQTEEEKQARFTSEPNGVGFNALDSEILSSFAEQLSKNPDYHLSERQFEVARKRLPKYAGQIQSLINSKSK